MTVPIPPAVAEFALLQMLPPAPVLEAPELDLDDYPLPLSVCKDMLREARDLVDAVMDSLPQHRHAAEGSTEQLEAVEAHVQGAWASLTLAGHRLAEVLDQA